jgi:hypothetical protein
MDVIKSYQNALTWTDKFKNALKDATLNGADRHQYELAIRKISEWIDKNFGMRDFKLRSCGTPTPTQE